MKAGDYHDIGQFFKESRESLNISLQNAAHDMNMRTHYVEALESGKLDIMPGKAYVRGYIKNYALYLGIDPQEALTVFDAVSVEVKQEFFIPEPTVSENLPSRTVFLMLLALMALMLGYYALPSKEHEEIKPTVADVPANLLIAAESAVNPRNAEWMQCLDQMKNDCFYNMLARDVLLGVEQGYRRVFKFLTVL